jgi:uncharacterized protein YprB with RNaseH-like and TPR domain
MSRYIFDLETNGLLDYMNVIHSLVIRDMDTLETFIFRKNDKEDNIKKGIKMLAKADFVVGHNIIAFDIPAIQIVYPKFKVTGEIKDTLVLSRLVRANWYRS